MCGVVITTNHKTNGIHLPEDDRRHFVAWSSANRGDFPEAYWNELWNYYDYEAGDAHVAAYLGQLELADFNPKAPLPQTPAFWDIVLAGRAPEDAEMADALDQLGKPNAVTITQIINSTKDAHGYPSEFGLWLRDRANRRRIPHRLETCGYAAVPNPYANSGLWRVDGRRQIVYAKISLPRGDQAKAAETLANS